MSFMVIMCMLNLGQKVFFWGGGGGARAPVPHADYVPDGHAHCRCSPQVSRIAAVVLAGSSTVCSGHCHSSC